MDARPPGSQAFPLPHEAPAGPQQPPKGRVPSHVRALGRTDARPPERGIGVDVSRKSNGEKKRRRSRLEKDAFRAIVGFYCRNALPGGHAVPVPASAAAQAREGTSLLNFSAKWAPLASCLGRAGHSSPGFFTSPSILPNGSPAPIVRSGTVLPGGCNPRDISEGAGCKTGVFSIWKNFERGS